MSLGKSYAFAIHHAVAVEGQFPPTGRPGCEPHAAAHFALEAHGTARECIGLFLHFDGKGANRPAVFFTEGLGDCLAHGAGRFIIIPPEKRCREEEQDAEGAGQKVFFHRRNATGISKLCKRAY